MWAEVAWKVEVEAHVEDLGTLEELAVAHGTGENARLREEYLDGVNA